MLLVMLIQLSKQHQPTNDPPTHHRQEYAGQLKVVKVNHTPNPELIAKYKVGAA